MAKLILAIVGIVLFGIAYFFLYSNKSLFGFMTAILAVTAILSSNRLKKTLYLPASTSDDKTSSTQVSSVEKDIP